MNKEKKKLGYIAPNLEILRFQDADVISTSTYSDENTPNDTWQ